MNRAKDGARDTESEMPNTRIFYMYRDGANYKRCREVVVAGRFTSCQIEPYLDDGIWFIASQIGLPDPQLEWEEEGYAFPGGEDHVYCEFAPGDVEPTADPPTVPVTAADLAGRLRAAAGRWDIEGAMRRLGFGGVPVEPGRTKVVRVRAVGHDSWSALAEVPADTTADELQMVARRVAQLVAPSALFLLRPDLAVEDAGGEPEVRLWRTTTGKWHAVGHDEPAVA